MRNVLPCLVVLIAGASSPYHTLYKPPPTDAPPAEPVLKVAPPAEPTLKVAEPVDATPRVVLPPPPADTMTAPASAALCGCEVACRRERLWLSTDYLMWWMRGSPLPPLVTTGAPTGAFPGALGRPDTVVLFGGNDVNTGIYNGARYAAGIWLGRNRNWGLEGTYMFLGTRNTTFFAASTGAAGTQVLARPFGGPLGNPLSAVVAVPPGVFPEYPAGIAGDVLASVATDLEGFEANGVRSLRRSANSRFELIGGFRYLHLRDRLMVVNNFQVGPATTRFANSTVSVFDLLDAQSHFYGAQIGARGEWRYNRVVVSGSAKVALGNTHQDLIITGSTRVAPTGLAANTVPFGLLATLHSIGSYDRDRFSVVPEGAVNVGYQLTRTVRVNVGYTFLYWNSVARAGDQTEPRAVPFGAPNLFFVPAVAILQRQASDVKERALWAQGLNFGLELRY